MPNTETNRPSSLDRRIQCTASAYFEPLYKEEKSSESAEIGTKLHEYLEKDLSSEDLPADQQWNIDTAREQIEQLLSELKERETGIKIHKEVKLEVHLDFDLFTKGTADVVIETDTSIIVIDYKSGRNQVDKASYQLQAYALGASDKFGGNRDLIVGVCQPACYSKIQLLRFNQNNAEYKFRELLEQQRENPYNFRTGSNCNYCNYRNLCPARKAENNKLEKVASTITKDNAVQFLENYAIVNNMLKQAYDEVKVLVEAGEVEGYKMKEVAGRQFCTDIDGLFAEWKDHFSEQEFIQFCDVSLSKFVDSAKRKLKDSEGLKTLKEAELRVKQSIKEYTSRKASSKRIEKIK